MNNGVEMTFPGQNGIYNVRILLLMLQLQVAVAVRRLRCVAFVENYRRFENNL